MYLTVKQTGLSIKDVWLRSFLTFVLKHWEAAQSQGKICKMPYHASFTSALFHVILTYCQQSRHCAYDLLSSELSLLVF